MMKYQNATNEMAQFVTLKSLIWPWGQSSRSKVTNNGTWHIVWRWSTCMPNMQSLSWTTKKLQPGHDLLRTHGRTDGLITIGRPTQSGGVLIIPWLSTCVVTSMRVNILFQCVTKRVAVHWEFFNYTRGRIIWIYMQFSRNMTEDPLEYHIEK